MGILSVNLNSINLDHTYYKEDDPDTIILVKRLAWHRKFEKCKTPKQELNEESMSVAWHPKRWSSFYMSEDEKKQTEPIFIE